MLRNNAAVHFSPSYFNSQQLLKLIWIVLQPKQLCPKIVPRPTAKLQRAARLMIVSFVSTRALSKPSLNWSAPQDKVGY